MIGCSEKGGYARTLLRGAFCTLGADAGPYWAPTASCVNLGKKSSLGIFRAIFGKSLSSISLNTAGACPGVDAP